MYYKYTEAIALQTIAQTKQAEISETTINLMIISGLSTKVTSCIKACFNVVFFKTWIAWLLESVH